MVKRVHTLVHSNWRSGTRLSSVLVFLLIVSAVVQCLVANWHMDNTFDEHFHWSWNYRLYENENPNRDNVSNFNSTTPILQLNVAFSKLFENVGMSHRARNFVRRLPNVLWLLGIFFLAYQLASKACNQTAGYLAVILCALDANLITHSSILTVDSAFAFCTLLFCWSVYRIVEKPSWISCATFGVALSLAFSAKFSAMFLVFGLAFFPLLFRRYPKFKLQYVFYPILVFIVFCFLTSATYRFVDVLKPFSEIKFYSSPFTKFSELYPSFRLPLPADFITGIDRCLSVERNTYWSIAFLDHYWDSGVWYYFLIIWFIKTPVFIVFITLTGLLLLFKSRKFYSFNVVRFLLAIFFLFFCYFSFVFRTMVGFRYILMCVPLLYVLAAIGLYPILLEKRGRILLLVGVIVSSIELFLYFKNPLSFTNLVVQPKKYAYRLISDSNIHWGQNHSRLAQYLQDYNIPTQNSTPFHILPGRNLIDLNHLVGVWYNRAQYTWVRNNLEPVKHLGHNYLLYYVSKDKFNKFLFDERRLTSKNSFIYRCRFSGLSKRLTSAQALELYPQQESRLCIQANDPSVFSVTNLGQAFDIAPFKRNIGCRFRNLARNQEAWFQLDPGMYEFCVKARQARRLRLSVSSGDLQVYE